MQPAGMPQWDDQGGKIFFDALLGDAAGFNAVWLLAWTFELEVLQLGNFILPCEARCVVGYAMQEDLGFTDH